jgi:hypothetical protein
LAATSTPDACPFCRSFDIRPLTNPGIDLLGFRCHDCQRTFYVTAATLASIARAAHTSQKDAGAPPEPVKPDSRDRRRRSRRAGEDD